ncbi:MAG: hypothetical protein U0797_25725 [Gemmataceae bacterium]
MATTMPCPRCQLPVEIDDEAADLWLTCRHCLGSLRNPRYDEATTTRPLPSPRPEAALSCDVCGEAMQPAWRYCPHCNTPRGRSEGASRDTGLERDVRRDSTASGWVAGGLCAALGVAAMLFLATGGGGFIIASPEGASIGVLVFLAVGAVVVLVTSHAVTGRDRAGKVVSGVLGGIAIVAIVGLGFVLMVCAGFVHFLSTCGKGTLH